MAQADSQRLTRECLITTGATAPFPELVHAVLQPDCLQALKAEGYTHVTFQVGASLQYYHRILPKDTMGLKLTAFDFHPDLKNDMRKCLERDGNLRGSAICAAGSGTILDAMRFDLPLIVVPNLSLLDNHQKELADEVERQGYVTQSTVTGLVEAIQKCQKLADETETREQKRIMENREGFARIVDQVAGYGPAVENSEAILDSNAREG